MRLGDGAIHVIDSPIEHGFGFTPSISLTVRAASADAVDGMFSRQGGTVLMPLDRYPFSERFGWVTDRFGVSWQVTWA
jgi:predicted 3-demethylubiquinone-9 3-methyltransferase (glyoxalase superfamily)